MLTGKLEAQFLTQLDTFNVYMVIKSFSITDGHLLKKKKKNGIVFLKKKKKKHARGKYTSYKIFILFMAIPFLVNSLFTEIYLKMYLGLYVQW